jgi:hypothetical protein
MSRLIIQFVHVGKFGVPVDFARLPAEKGPTFAEAATHVDEFEGVANVSEARGHWPGGRRLRRSS